MRSLILVMILLLSAEEMLNAGCRMRESYPASKFLSSSLLQSFTILGSVRDQTGQAVSGVRISLLDDNYGPLRTMFVDGSGRFKVTGIGSGVYLVRIETQGTPFEEQQQRLELQSLRIRGAGNETVTIDFVLKPRKGQPIPSGGPLFAQPVPEQAKDEYEKGAASLRNNKQEAGYAALRRALEIFPDYFDALELLGTEYVKRGQFEPALPILMRAIEVNKRASKSFYALGVAHLKLNHHAESAEWLSKAAELDSGNPNVFMMLGLAHGNNRAFDQSETAFKKALRLGGQAAAEAHFYLAGIYNQQERYRESWQELERYLKEAKDIKDRNLVKGMIEKMKEKEKAKSVQYRER
jgi:tetratricopeptide (TPR) repeat protein